MPQGGPRVQRPVGPYEVLQVTPHASHEVIQAAYRALARTYHPDVDPSPRAALRMQRINAAYATLSDPVRRAAYDARARECSRPALDSSRPARPGVIRSVPTAASQTRTGVSLARWAALALALITVVWMVAAVVWALGQALDERPPLLNGATEVRGGGEAGEAPLDLRFLVPDSRSGVGPRNTRRP